MSRPLRKGRIELLDDAAEEPRTPCCWTYHLYYQRQNGNELGGWWAVLVPADGRVDHVVVRGPYRAAREAEWVARQLAARNGCTFLS
jgi:hypothetical protein